MKTRQLKIKTTLLSLLAFIFIQCAVVKKGNELLRGKYISRSGDFFDFKNQTFTMKLVFIIILLEKKREID